LLKLAEAALGRGDMGPVCRAIPLPSGVTSACRQLCRCRYSLTLRLAEFSIL
jgi:hypothetical protein